MDKNDLIKIIIAGTYAPSGDNCQPWKFQVKDSQISVFDIPNRDNPIYNFKRRGSFIAHGALIENIIITSSTMGFSAKIILRPDPAQSDLVARVTFESKQPANESLFPYITKRATNRKTYKNSPLTPEQKDELLRSAQEIAGTKIILVENPKIREIIGKAVSVNEIILLENKDLHQTFFSDIVWSAGEENQKRSGLYIKTLELPPPVQLAFRLFKHWPIMNFLGKLNFPRAVAKGNSRIYSSGAATAIILTDGDSLTDFINVGRVMQRAWLKATEMDLGFQPIAGALFLAQRVMAGETNFLSPRHQELLSKAYNEIKSAFGVENGTIAMLFRIGQADRPSARSSRLPPDIKFESSHSQN